MSATTPELETKAEVETYVDAGEQRLTLGGIGYVAYESIIGVLRENAGVRLLYAGTIGAARWTAQFPEWARTTILPRMSEG